MVALDKVEGLIAGNGKEYQYLLSSMLLSHHRIYSPPLKPLHAPRTFRRAEGKNAMLYTSPSG